MLVQTEAIVLSARRYRESSQLVTLYTEDFGKCSVVAPQSRRRKMLSNALQPLRCSWVEFYKRPHRTLFRLSKAEALLPFRKIIADYDRMSVGLAIVESIYRTQPLEESNPTLYQMIKKTLMALETLSGHFIELFGWFVLQLSKLSGFALDPLVDHTTGRLLDPQSISSLLFSVDRGCPLHGSASPTAVVVRIDRATLEFLQQCQRLDDPMQVHTLPLLSSRAFDQLLRLFDRFYSYHLNCQLLSQIAVQMLQSVRAEQYAGEQ